MKLFYTFFLSIFLLLTCISGFTEELNLRQALIALGAGDEVKFNEIMDKLLANGDIDAQIFWGVAKTKNNELFEAEKTLLPIAKSGNPLAQYHLAQVYAKASPPNPDKENYWLSESAKNGFTSAKRILALRTIELPKETNGSLRTDELAKYMGLIARSKLSSTAEKDIVLNCYKLNKEQFNFASESAITNCSTELKIKWGELIPVEKAETFSNDYVSCTNNIIFKAGGITIQDLISCLPAEE